MSLRESSSSSSSSGSTYESETGSKPEPKTAASELGLSLAPLTEIPPSVKNILDKIDAAQLDRARKDVSKQLFAILDNVNRVCYRFKGDEGMHAEIEEQFFLSGTWAEKKRRAFLLDKIAILLKTSTAQGKDLEFVLESLKDWDEMLSESKEQVGETHTVQWVSDMETMLLNSLGYTEACIMRLIDLCTPLVEHRRKKRGKSTVPKTGMWRAWREKVAQKPQEAQPLSPEQMLEDESLTFSKTSELLSMLQEFVGSTLFNKAEAVVVKYIVRMVANLTKAFALLTEQCHGLQAKYNTLSSQESRKQEVQYVSLQKEVQMLNEKKASLEARIQSIEQKCRVLLVANEAMQQELHEVKEKAALKKEPSLKFGARASYEWKSQEEDNKHLGRKKDAKLSAEKLSWKFQADLGGKRETKLPDKRQLQRPSVERAEDTSDEQDPKFLDKRPALKALVERAEDTIDKQDVKLRDRKRSLKASVERAEGARDKQDANLLDKKSVLRASAEGDEGTVDRWDAAFLDRKQTPKSSLERAEGTSDKQDAKLRDRKLSLKASVERAEGTSHKQGAQEVLLERAQDTVVKWDTVLLEEKQGERRGNITNESSTQLLLENQEGTPGALAGAWHNQPLDNEQAAAAEVMIDEWHVKLLDDELAEAAGGVTDERGAALLDGTQEVAEDVTSEWYESLPDEHELGADRAGDTERLPSSAELPWQGVLRTGKQKRKEESLYAEETCTRKPRSSSSRSELDPSSALYGFHSAILTYLEQTMEQLWKCPSPGKRRAERMLPKDPEAQSLYMVLERKLEECFSEMKVKYSSSFEEQKLPRSLELTEEHEEKATPPLEVLPEISVPGKEVPLHSIQLSDHDSPLLESKIAVISPWELPAALWKEPDVPVCFQVSRQWQEEEQDQLQRQAQGLKGEEEEEEQMEHLGKEEPLQEEQKEWKKEKQRQWKKGLEEQAEEQRVRQQELEEVQRLYHQGEEEQQRRWRQQEAAHGEQQRRWRQEEEAHGEQQRRWRQEEEAHGEQQRCWRQEEVARAEQQRRWRQEEVARAEQQRCWRQEEEAAHAEQQRRWRQEEAARAEQQRRWRQEEVARAEQQRRWPQEEASHSWQEEAHSWQEQEQPHSWQEQCLIPRPKPIPRSQELGALERLAKPTPLRPRRATAKEELLLCEYFQPSAQQLVPAQSKVSLHSPAQSTEETSWLPTLAQKTKEKSLVSSHVSEKRYWVDVEAQRENLVLLGQATQKCGLPAHLHTQAKEVATETVHADVERLALLFHKYISFCHLQRVRQTLMSRLEAARAANDGAEVRNLYTYVERVDAYRKKVLQCWVAKQKAVEHARRHCLGRMISLFAQLRLSSELHLNSPAPLMIKAVDEMKKEFQSLASARSKSPGFPSPLASVKKVRDFTHPAAVSEQVCNQMDSVWRTDVISHSFPIVPKPPVSLLWSQAGGFPDVPRFLELDVSSVRSKPLESLMTRVQNLPRWKTYGHK